MLVCANVTDTRPSRSTWCRCLFPGSVTLVRLYWWPRRSTGFPSSAEALSVSSPEPRGTKHPLATQTLSPKPPSCPPPTDTAQERPTRTERERERDWENEIVGTGLLGLGQIGNRRQIISLKWIRSTFDPVARVSKQKKINEAVYPRYSPSSLFEKKNKTKQNELFFSLTCTFWVRAVGLEGHFAELVHHL